MTATRSTILALALAALAGLLVAALPLPARADHNTPTPNNSVASQDVINDDLTRDDLAPNSVGNDELRDGSVTSAIIAGQAITDDDIGADQVGASELKQGVEDALAAAVEPDLNGLEADSPYPGATDLGDLEDQGDNSDEVWAGDEGATLQQSWVQCAPGKVATGGGHSRADESVAAIRNLQIVTSTPAVIEDGEVISLTGGGSIEGDEAGSIKPNGWLIEGFNNGTADLIARPSVVCTFDD